jgi:hypothetical protein
VGRPEELAAVIAFLRCDAASVASSVDRVVDGDGTNQVLEMGS